MNLAPELLDIFTLRSLHGEFPLANWPVHAVHPDDEPGSVRGA
jgi:hypothetical protein